MDVSTYSHDIEYSQKKVGFARLGKKENHQNSIGLFTACACMDMVGFLFNEICSSEFCH